MNENELLAAIIGQLKQINANSLSSNLTGNILWVDAVNGTANGAAGNANKPFLTLAQAKAAASSGDLVWVRPGNYTVTDTILKDQVNWYFSAGATVTRTNSNSAISGILDDAGTAITSTVFGEGDFLLEINNAAGAGGFIGCVIVSHASSNITIHARSIGCHQNASGADAPMGVVCTNGTLRVECSHSIYGNDDGAGTSGTAIYWETGLFISKAPSIYATNFAILSANSVGGSPVANMYVDADEIYTTGASQANTDPTGAIGAYLGGNANAAVWVRCGTLKSNAGSAHRAVSLDAGNANKIYVSAQKIFGICECKGGLLYVTAEKAEALADVDGTHLALFAVATGGTFRYNVRQHDPKSFTGISHLINGGTFISNEIEYTSGSGSNGLSISSGTARIQTAYLNTAANNAGNPVTISGGTLILNVSTLVAEAGRDSITAGTAQNVICTGSWANKAVNGNVTVIITGGLSVDADVA